MVIALVIARGGSKRLPRKNVKMFCGHPLVAWSIVQAKCSHLVDETWLSTDDDEIAGIGETYGAEVIRRPEWLCKEELAANPIFRHMIERLWERHGKDGIDRVITMLPTAPVKQPDEIDRGVEMSLRLGALTVLPIVPQREMVLYRLHHPFMSRAVLFDKSYKYGLYPGGWAIIPPRFYMEFTGSGADDDATLNARAENGMNDDSLPNLEFCYITVPVWEMVEVDTLPEFELAESIMERHILKGKSMEVYYEYRDG